MLKRLAVIVWRMLPGWAGTALTWCFNAHFVIGTVAVIQDHDGRVLLARHTYRRSSPWALPGGWVRRGEDPGDAIVREIAEETGLTIEVLGPLTVQQEGARHFTIVYAARVTGGAFRSSAEVSEVRFVASGDWPVGLRRDHKALIVRFAVHRTAGRL
ncbi:MAG TPA: NUDIX hydrolase [bacterium]|nr:NUDIX hydrolase [bacterium]